tara:strand:+ start:274 stop:1173 length:900 start_codon:yes stop_codon:yes gene_type:complete
MSTEQVAKRTLPAKFNKFMVYGYWLANQLKSRELINEEVYNTIVKQQNMFDSVEAQTESFETFLEEFKSANKTMKQEVRTHNKPKKVKKEKVVDPDAPKAKRGRKKKVVEDNLTPEEKLVEEIVSAAHSETVEKPVVEETTKKVRKSKKEKVEEPIEQPIEEVVEQPAEEVVEQPVKEVVEQPVEEKPKKVRKSKKTKTEEVVEEPKVEEPKMEEKPKKQTRAAPAKKSKKEKEPEIAPVTPELKEEPIENDEDEEIETTIIVQDGVEYLVDQNNVVYHRTNFDEIGVYDPNENKVKLN